MSDAIHPGVCADNRAWSGGWHWYAAALADVAAVVADPPWGRANAWLTTADLHHGTPDAVCAALAQHGIEARHVWKPMHLQPVFADTPAVGGAVAEGLFSRGVCLPSGQRMTDNDVDRVAETARDALAAAPVDVRDDPVRAG